MKHKYAKFLSILFAATLILSSCITSFASGFDCTLEYNPNTLSVNLDGSSNTNITIYVYKSSITPSTFSDGNLPVALWQYDIHSRQEFDYSLPLGEALPSGEYVVKARNRDGSVSITFKHIDPASANAALQAINMAATQSSAKVLKALSDGAPELLLNSSEISTYGVIISDIIYGRKLSFDSPNSLVKTIEEAKAIYAIINAAGADFSVAVEANASALGIDKAAYYDALSDVAKTKFVTFLKADDGYKTGPFNTSFKQLSALAAVASASRWQDIKNAVTISHKTVIGIDTSSLSAPDSVFRKMMNYTYNEFDDISANFALALATPAPSKPSYSGGSSGGGVPVMGDTTGYTDDIKQPETKAAFADIDDNHWAKASIDTLVAKGVLSGYPDNTFRPANNITRAEFVKMIAGAFSVEGSASLPFTDIPADAWYVPSLSAAYSNGIISGMSADSFMPDSFITRQDACLIIYRIIKDSLISGGELPFVDNPDIAVYARDAVAALCNGEIVSGVGDGRFAPTANIDRQSAAVLINNSLKNY